MTQNFTVFLLQYLLFMSLITAVRELGGFTVLTKWFLSHWHTHRQTEAALWSAALLGFFDPRAGVMFASSMGPLAKNMRISDRKLALISHLNAVCVSGLLFCGPGIPLVLESLQNVLKELGSADINVFSFLYSLIPFQLFNGVILLFTGISCFQLKDSKRLYRAEYAARTAGGSAEQILPIADTLPKPEKSSALSLLAIPVYMLGTVLGTLLTGAFHIGFPARIGIEYITSCFCAGDLGLAGLVSILCAFPFVFFSASKQAKKEWPKRMARDTAQHLKGMLLLLISRILSLILSNTQAASLLGTILQRSVPHWLLPAGIFLITGTIVFITGDRISAICAILPLAGQLAWMSVPDSLYFAVAVSTVFSGASFGLCICPFSDIGILAADAVGCSYAEHYKDVLLYALLGAGIAILFGWLPLSLGFYSAFSFIMCIFAAYGVYDTISKNADHELAKELMKNRQKADKAF